MSPVSPGHNKRKVHLCGQTGLTGVRWRRRKRKRPAGLRSVTVYQCLRLRPVLCVSTEAGMGGVATQKSCLWWPCSHLQVFSCATAVNVMIVGPHHVWTRQDKNVKAGLCFLISLTCSILHLADHMWMFSHTHTLPHCVCVYQPIIVSSAMISGCHSNRQRAAGW